MHKVQRLISTHPEDVLTSINVFDNLRKLLDITTGNGQFWLFGTMLGGYPANRWRVICNDYPNAAQQTVNNFCTTRNNFFKFYCNKWIALGTKHWVNSIKKPI